MGLGTRETPEDRDRDMSWTSLALVRLGRDKQSRPWERQQDLRSYNHKVLFCLLVLFLVFGRTIRLVVFWFPDQGLNPALGSESRVLTIGPTGNSARCS